MIEKIGRFCTQFQAQTFGHSEPSPDLASRQRSVSERHRSLSYDPAGPYCHTVKRPYEQRRLAGVAVGMAGAYFAWQSIIYSIGLFNFRPVDPLIFIAIPLALLLITVLASWARARRWARC